MCKHNFTFLNEHIYIFLKLIFPILHYRVYLNRPIFFLNFFSFFFPRKNLKYSVRIKKFILVAYACE